MKEKPWLKAKTAGEAYLAAFLVWSLDNRRESVDDFLSAAVIEWHESRRVKVGEYYELTEYRVGHNRRFDTFDDAWSWRTGIKSCKVLKVTRYRRAK
jgi:hypothetical protein